MDRRSAILTLLALPLGKFDVYAVQHSEPGPGMLTINLDDWAGIEVRRGEWRTIIPAREIQRALSQEHWAGVEVQQGEWRKSQR